MHGHGRKVFPNRTVKEGRWIDNEFQAERVYKAADKPASPKKKVLKRAATTK